ncbi:MAG: DUF2252 family protein [Anaerolineales bacterium]
MKIFKATRKYEKWLRQEHGVFEDDLSFKAKKLAEDPSAFLRGTFYRWMQLWPNVCKNLSDAPLVLSIGDLHAANFGTWRDARDQLVWGINDFDECAPLPYPLDLTRLAASVELASESQELKAGLEEACEAILDGYQESLETGGKPFILNDGNEWLREAYVQGGKSSDEYWMKLEQLPDMEFEIPPEARIALEAALPTKGLEYRLKHRLAGVGSLGRPRYTALATFGGEPIARETKPLLASAALWADKKHRDAEIYYEEVLARAVRSLDPLVKVYEGWVVRRLAPDCHRIELSELGPERYEKRMLRAMGWETGNIHLGTPSAIRAVLKDLQNRKKDWLVKAAGRMVKATRKDWKMWKAENPD